MAERDPAAAAREASQAAAQPRPIGRTVLLAMLTGMGALSIDMYLPSLPSIAAQLGAGDGGTQLTLSAFFIGFALGQLVYGPLSDRFGRRWPLLAGMALYIAASGACALAGSIEALIFFRFVEAIGACSGPVLARAIVRDLYGREGSARIMSYMMVAMGLGPLLAPLIGGYALVWAGWRASFVILAALGAAFLILSARQLPESLPPERRPALSPLDMAQGYFLLLGDRAYLGYAICAACIYGGLFAYLSGSPFVFITLYGVPPQHYGLLFGINVIGIMSGALLNGRLVARFGSERLLRAGLAVAAVSGSALAAVAVLRIGGLPTLFVPLFCFISTMGVVGANAMAGALASRPHMAGTGSALAGALQFGAGALTGTAVGALADGTAMPMAGVIGGMGLLGLGAYRSLVRPSAPS